MCRWLAYSGSPVLLEDLLFKPENSLVVQSRHSRLGVEPINGDGFGVGWYGAQETPGIYHSIEPAWNDRNLRELSAHARAGRVFAHIRATTGTAVQQTNCHPFRHGRWLWMHNGAIADFPSVKRDLTLAVEPALFPEIEGSTDSELFFYLALTFGLEEDPPSAVARAVGLIEETGRRHGVDVPDPDDRGHHGRGDHVGVSLLQRGEISIAVPQHRHRHAPAPVSRQRCAPRALRGRSGRGVRAARGPARRVAGSAGVHVPGRPCWTRGDGASSRPRLPSGDRPPLNRMRGRRAPPVASRLGAPRICRGWGDRRAVVH